MSNFCRLFSIKSKSIFSPVCGAGSPCPLYEISNKSGDKANLYNFLGNSYFPISLKPATKYSSKLCFLDSQIQWEYMVKSLSRRMH